MVLYPWKRPSGCSPAVPSGTRCRVSSHSVTQDTKGEELRGHASQPPLTAGGRTKAREELALSWEAAESRGEIGSPDPQAIIP